jgi:hypothetical protein
LRADLAEAFLSRARRRVLFIAGRSASDFLFRTKWWITTLLGSRDFDLHSHHWGGPGAAGREIVLLGRAAARARASFSPELAALTAAPPFSMVVTPVWTGRSWQQSAVWLAPVLGSQWWRQPANRRLGFAFFRLVVGRMELSCLDQPPRPATIKSPLDLLLGEG